jgi:hypothetical protein
MMFFTVGSITQDHFVLEGGEGRPYASYHLHGGGRCDLVLCEHVRGDGQNGAQTLLIIRDIYQERHLLSFSQHYEML